MLLPLILLCWCAALGLVVAVCQVSSRGDAEPALIVAESARGLGLDAGMWSASDGSVKATRSARRPLTLEGERAHGRPLAGSVR